MIHSIQRTIDSTLLILLAMLAIGLFLLIWVDLHTVNDFKRESTEVPGEVEAPTPSVNALVPILVCCCVLIWARGRAMKNSD